MKKKNPAALFGATLELTHLSKREEKQNVWPGHRKYFYRSTAKLGQRGANLQTRGASGRPPALMAGKALL